MSRTTVILVLSLLSLSIAAFLLLRPSSLLLDPAYDAVSAAEKVGIEAIMLEVKNPKKIPENSGVRADAVIEIIPLKTEAKSRTNPYTLCAYHYSYELSGSKADLKSLQPWLFSMLNNGEDQDEEEPEDNTVLGMRFSSGRSIMLPIGESKWSRNAGEKAMQNFQLSALAGEYRLKTDRSQGSSTSYFENSSGIVLGVADGIQSSGKVTLTLRPKAQNREVTPNREETSCDMLWKRTLSVKN